jgi:hypothetical protein
VVSNSSNLQEMKEQNITAAENWGRTTVVIRGGYIIPTKEWLRRCAMLMFFFGDLFSLRVALDESQRGEGLCIGNLCLKMRC